MFGGRAFRAGSLLCSYRRPHLKRYLEKVPLNPDLFLKFCCTRAIPFSRVFCHSVPHSFLAISFFLLSLREVL